MEEPKQATQGGKFSVIVKISELVPSPGNRVAPDTVRASDIAELILHLEKAVIEMTAEGDGASSEDQANDPELSLVSVGEGSNILGMLGSDRVSMPFDQLMQSISNSDFNNIPVRCHVHLKAIFKQAVKRKWKIELRSDQIIGHREAVISERSPIPEIKARVAKGGTNIYGKLMRIGSANPSASVKLDDGANISVEMTREMVKDLEARHRLYDRVGFEGLATWALKDWKIIEFRADRIIPLSTSGTKLTDMFDALAESAGGRWDDVDAIEFVNKLRQD